MTAFHATLLVAGREVHEAFRRRSFWIVVMLMFVGSAAAVVVPDVVGDGGPTKWDVVIVDGDDALADAIRDIGPALDAEITTASTADATTARQMVDDGDADVGVVVGDAPIIIVRSGEHETLVSGVSQTLASMEVVERLQQAGLTDAEVESALAVQAPRLEELDAESESRRLASFVLALALYLLLVTLMVQVANGVAIEKSNRISEVLLAVVRPGPLLFGKVLGVGVAGMCSLLAALVPVVVKLIVGGNLPSGLAGAVAGSAVWFALGLTLYLLIAGSLGALVERQEEAGSVVTPLTAILVGTFIVAQGGADSPVGTVLAYVPLTSPLIVPTRIAQGVASPFELVASVVILVVSIGAAARVGTVVYSRAIVRTGRRLKLRDVLRSASDR